MKTVDVRFIDETGCETVCKFSANIAKRKARKAVRDSFAIDYIGNRQKSAKCEEQKWILSMHHDAIGKLWEREYKL